MFTVSQNWSASTKKSHTNLPDPASIISHLRSLFFNCSTLFRYRMPEHSARFDSVIVARYLRKTQTYLIHETPLTYFDNERSSNWSIFIHQSIHTSILDIQGVSKVLEPFVFAICSKPLGAQTKYYCQIKAEILKFMWVCGKSQFE
jgi:hypothetical protein